MANQSNFKTDIEDLSSQYTRFTVSRVFDTTQDDLLSFEYPAVLNDPNLYVQLSFYSLADQSIIYSTALIRSEEFPDAFFTRTLQYEDDTTRELFFINFSKLTLDDVLPVGQFEVVLNFFVPELGNYLENPFRIVQISPSRTELELTLNSSFRTPEMLEKLESFARPHISKQWVTQSIDLLYNKTNGGGIPTVTSSLSVAELSEEIPMGLLDETRDQLFTIVNGLLTSSYGHVTSSIQTMLQDGKTRFTDEELFALVEESITTEYAALLEQIRSTQMSLKFSLPDLENGGTE